MPKTKINYMITEKGDLKLELTIPSNEVTKMVISKKSSLFTDLDKVRDFIIPENDQNETNEKFIFHHNIKENSNKTYTLDPMSEVILEKQIISKFGKDESFTNDEIKLIAKIQEEIEAYYGIIPIRMAFPMLKVLIYTHFKNNTNSNNIISEDKKVLSPIQESILIKLMDTVYSNIECNFTDKENEYIKNIDNTSLGLKPCSFNDFIIYSFLQKDYTLINEISAIKNPCSTISKYILSKINSLPTGGIVPLTKLEISYIKAIKKISGIGIKLTNKEISIYIINYFNSNAFVEINDKLSSKL